MINDATIEALSQALLAHIDDDDAYTMPLVVHSAPAHFSPSIATIQVTGCIGGHASFEAHGVFNELDLELIAGYLLAAARALRKQREIDDKRIINDAR